MKLTQEVIDKIQEAMNHTKMKWGYELVGW